MIVKRTALTDDIDSIRAVWSAGFPEDRPEDRDAFLAAVPLSWCHVLAENGTPVSMMYGIPVRCGEQRLLYVYAAATLPSHRGRGLFAELLRTVLEEARQMGFDGSFLHPAEPSLVGYYERLGYQTWTCCERVTGNAGECVPVHRLTPEQYADRRLPSEALVWPRELPLLAASYDTALAAGNAVLLCSVYGETVYFKECLGTVDLAAVCAALGCRDYEWRAPADHGEVYTMIYPFGDIPASPYVGPVWD